MYSPIRKSGLDTLPHSKSINSFPAGDSAGMLHNSIVRVVTYECECSVYSYRAYCVLDRRIGLHANSS